MVLYMSYSCGCICDFSGSAILRWESGTYNKQICSIWDSDASYCVVGAGSTL